MHKIGFMQGRLSPQIDGKIQAFPWHYWDNEFRVAGEARFDTIEWTLDAERLLENPLLTQPGQSRIRELSKACGVDVSSLTGDCFMQAPFWKASDTLRVALLDDLSMVLEGCAAVGIRWIVIPLVDNGRLENDEQRKSLLDGLLPFTRWLTQRDMAVLFESDFRPESLARLMRSFPDAAFGINYDIGNSASLGFDPEAELAAYGSRVRNVHVKDRVLGGTTVPLGTGSADFATVFRELYRIGYRGDFILQTARAPDGSHLETLVRYRCMVARWIEEFSA